MDSFFMRVLIAGYAFWFFALMLACRVLAGGSFHDQPARRRRNAASLLCLIILGAVILFRPHEDIFGGQDGGAYLNTAARLARNPRLSYVDPLLDAAPPQTRPLFLYYGPERPYLSKYACGRVKDLNRAICGVWFQPAYPIVASIAARHLGPHAILYVIPFFALLLALALHELFGELWPDHRPYGVAATFFFLVMPLAVWHARHPRPEIVASFLLIAGITLLMRAWRRLDSPANAVDVLLGSTALALAPFFHITAWMVVIPAGAAVALAVLAGRRVFLLHTLLSYAGLRLFVWQLRNINDTYGLLPRAPWLATHVAAQTLVFTALTGLLLFFSYRRWFPPQWTMALSRRMHSLTAAALVGACFTCWIVARWNPPTKDWPPVHRYMYRTDISALLNFISRPVVFLILCGLLLMALSARPSRTTRLAALWTMVPATLLIGNFYDFFVTRYLLVAFLPIAALALASVVARLATARFRGARVTALIVSLLFTTLMIRNRLHLITTVEYRGLQNFIASLAKPILRANGILLFEYPRLAAPFDLMFGVPTLALHNERDDDYRIQEHAWKTIMRRYPNRPAYFITPFQPPRSDVAGFTPLGSASYAGPLLVQKRWDLPTDVHDWNVSLRMYRMHPADAQGAPEPRFPDVFKLGNGNMGLRRFARVPQKPRETDAVRLRAREGLCLALPPDFNHRSSVELLAFFVVTNELPVSLSATISCNEMTSSSHVRRLVNEWHLARFSFARGLSKTNSFTLSASTEVLLHDILALDGTHGVSLLAARHDLPKERLTLQPVFTRWARQDAAACIPVPMNRAFLLVFHTAPDELSKPVFLTATSPALPESAPRELPPGRWMWSAWPLTPAQKTHWTWVTFHADPSFDPQMRGYPQDLITHFGWVCVVPAD